MKKLYALVPLIGIAVFVFFYTQELGKIEERQTAKKAEEARIKKEKSDKEIADREKAYQDAIKLAERRKIEKAEKDAKDAKEKEQLANLKDELDKAYREKDRQTKAAARLGDEIKIEEEEVAKLKTTVATARGEVEFLGQYVTKAQANKKSFEGVLTKIEAANKAAEAAAKAAAAAAKN